MRRLLLVLAVAALMAVMVVASGMPAFAKQNCFSEVCGGSGSPGNSDLAAAGGGGSVLGAFSNPDMPGDFSQQGNNTISGGPGRCTGNGIDSTCVGKQGSHPPS